MNAKPKVLVIDDEDTIRRTLRLCLEADGYEVIIAPSGEAGLVAAAKQSPDLALVDLRLGGMDGIAVTKALADSSPGTAVVVMTAYATIDNAVAAMRAGAADYLPKPFTPAAVRHLVGRVLDTARMRQELSEVRAKAPPSAMTSVCPAVQEAYRLADRVAASDATVLIRGETGTGKGVLARYIHAQSPRTARPFVTVNCATISPNLVENELFGHAKGAFTGADKARSGYVEVAKNGTLFIDEVGDLGGDVQGKLLRLLEEREYVRVGDAMPRRSDARVIAATHRDLKARAAAGTFRDDLYYRLDVVTITLPPLRERRDDVPKLVSSMLSAVDRSHGKSLRASPEAMAALVSYSWPGNIRELSNVLERATLLADGDVLTPDLLPEEVRSSATPSPGTSPDDESLEAAERRHIAQVLARHPTLDAAAKALGVDPSTLYRKRERYNLR